MEARAEKQYEHIEADSKKLLDLATQLDSAIRQANKNQMSLDIMRKAEEIERLAKSIKEKMRAQ